MQGVHAAVPSRLRILSHRKCRMSVPLRASFMPAWGGPPLSRRFLDASAVQPTALLSRAIASASSWKDLDELVQRYGTQMNANHISHALTRLDLLLSGEAAALGAADAAQVSVCTAAAAAALSSSIDFNLTSPSLYLALASAVTAFCVHVFV
jgi:hypothetical protein